VNNGVRWLFLLLMLVKSEFGFGQQRQARDFDSIIVAAQRAQAAGDYALSASEYAEAASIRPELPELWANLGLMQQETGNIPSAIESFQKANHLNASLYVPNLFLGIDFAHDGKPLQAIPYLIKSEKTNKTDPQAPLALGRAYISARKYSAAVEELDRATALDPKLGSAWLALGIARLDQVEVDARTMSEEGKQSPFSGTLYADSLFKQARFGEAASLYKTLLNSQPQPPCILSKMGFALLRDHDQASAISAFAAERAAHPECGMALIGQARIAIETGDTGRAVTLLKELWARDQGFFEANAALLLAGLPNDQSAAVANGATAPDGTPIPSDLRSALLSASDQSSEVTADPNTGGEPGRSAVSTVPEASHTAEEFYEKGQFRQCEVRLGSNLALLSADKLQLLAACAFQTGDDQVTYNAATALESSRPHALEALYWSIQSDEHLAIKSLTRFQQLDPDSAANHVLVGDIYNQLEKYDDAQSEYLKALEIAPGDPAASLGLATAYLNGNNIAGALEIAQSALVRSPDDPELNLVAAQALMGQHEYADAEPLLIKSLNGKPQMLPRIHVLIGKVYAETGRTEDAIEQLKLGASSDEDGTVQYLLARMYRKLGDTQDANKAIEQMKVIKEQREARGVKRVEDPDLSQLEPSTASASTP
jgi:tetratricopeptide (TPR) repeat protein